MIDFTNIIKSFERVKKSLPGEIGIIATTHFQGNFDAQGFVDVSVDKWQGRKNLTRSDRNFIKKKTGVSAAYLNKLGIDTAGGGRSILVASGDLRNSIGVGVCTFEAIYIQTHGIEYGHYHNIGDTRDGVKRQFMGESQVLNTKISRHIRKEIGDFLGKK